MLAAESKMVMTLINCLLWKARWFMWFFSSMLLLFKQFRYVIWETSLFGSFGSTHEFMILCGQNKGWMWLNQVKEMPWNLPYFSSLAVNVRIFAIFICFAMKLWNGILSLLCSFCLWWCLECTFLVFVRFLSSSFSVTFSQTSYLCSYRTLFTTLLSDIVLVLLKHHVFCTDNEGLFWMLPFWEPLVDGSLSFD
jgi:hypothetical protein